MKKKFTHIDKEGNPTMVDVSGKAATLREAGAQAVVKLGKSIISQMRDGELITKKGPVFQTAIIAGVMGAKKTSEMIPFCHPLSLEDCRIDIKVVKHSAVITSRVRTTGKTGVEMEALTAVTVASLTIYDMCKALSHDIEIDKVMLLHKTGGKKDFHR